MAGIIEFSRRAYSSVEWVSTVGNNVTFRLEAKVLFVKGQKIAKSHHLVTNNTNFPQNVPELHFHVIEDPHGKEELLINELVTVTMADIYDEVSIGLKIIEGDDTILTEYLLEVSNNERHPAPDEQKTKTINLYLGGAYWSGDKMLSEFKAKDYWEHGRDTPDSLINEVQPDDYLAIKTKAVRKDASLRILAIGRVTHNHQDGRTLAVKWIDNPPGLQEEGYLDFPKWSGYYSRTFHKARAEHAQLILGLTLSQPPYSEVARDLVIKAGKLSEIPTDEAHEEESAQKAEPEETTQPRRGLIKVPTLLAII